MYIYLYIDTLWPRPRCLGKKYVLEGTRAAESLPTQHFAYWLLGGDMYTHTYTHTIHTYYTYIYNRYHIYATPEYPICIAILTHQSLVAVPFAGVQIVCIKTQNNTFSRISKCPKMLRYRDIESLNI